MKRRPAKNRRRLFRANLALAKELWPGQIYKSQLRALETLTLSYGISLISGDLQLLKTYGMSPIQDFSGSPDAEDARGSE